MLTPALRDFHHTALNRHIDALDGMNPGEYASQYSTDDVDTAGLDERASLATFYRCFPYTGQDTMMVSINPGIVTNIEPGSESAMHAAVGRDYDAKAAISMQYILLYLLGEQTDGPMRTPRLFEQLASESSGRRFADAGVAEAYFQRDAAAAWKTAAEAVAPVDFDEWLPAHTTELVDVESGFLSEVYYSVAYKLATEDASGAKKALARELLPEEIRITDPELILSCGGLPWETLHAVFGGTLEPVQGTHVPSGVRAAAGNVFRGEIAGKTRYVGVLRHMSRMAHEVQQQVAARLAAEGVI